MWSAGISPGRTASISTPTPPRDCAKEKKDCIAKVRKNYLDRDKQINKNYERCEGVCAWTAKVLALGSKGIAAEFKDKCDKLCEATKIGDQLTNSGVAATGVAMCDVLEAICKKETGAKPF